MSADFSSSKNTQEAPVVGSQMHPPAAAPRTPEEVREAVLAHPRVVVGAGGTKPAASGDPTGSAALLDLSGLSGVLAYDPGEFTFTALAGTPVSEVVEMLAAKGQYLPFDPPLAEGGATLGGTVAAGVSGSGRFRYGGVRDFLIGIRFVDGRGILVRGGGNVVKNAAGFDYPKLMVGSLGRLGVLTEVTFKVFPAPKELATVEASYRSVEGAVDALVKLSRSRFTMEALDLVPTSGGASLLVRLGGLPTALGDRVARITSFLFEETGAEQISPAFPEDGVEYWRETASMSWVPEGHLLVKVPVTPQRIREADPVWASQGAICRYVAGGQNAWLAWPGSREELSSSLERFGLSGVILRGDPGPSPWIGALQGEGFLRRIAAALDPENRFGALDLWQAR